MFTYMKFYEWWNIIWKYKNNNPFITVLFKVIIAMKRHHCHSNSNKDNHLIRACLQVQNFSPLSSWWEARQCIGRHGAKEGAESTTSWLAGNRKRECRCTWWAHLQTSKPTPRNTLSPVISHLLQQGNTSNNGTPCESIGSILIQSTTLLV